MDRPDQGSEVRTRLSAGGRWIRTIGTPQRNDFSRPPPFDPPQFAFRKRNRLLRTRNRWFESASLLQRVINEPGRANWAINSPVAEEDCYLLANARASWLTAS